MIRKLSLLLLISFPLISCSTGYMPAQTYGGFYVNGYSDARTNANTAIVRYDGNRFMDPEKMRGYLLYRCAEVTIQNGYDYFIITSTNGSAVNVHPISRDKVYQTTIHPKGSSVGYRSTQYRGYQYTSSSVPDNDPTNQTPNYAEVAVIKMFQGKKPGNLPNAFDANDIIAHFGPSTF